MKSTITKYSATRYQECTYDLRNKRQRNNIMSVTISFQPLTKFTIMIRIANLSGETPNI